MCLITQNLSFAPPSLARDVPKERLTYWPLYRVSGSQQKYFFGSPELNDKQERSRIYSFKVEDIGDNAIHSVSRPSRRRPSDLGLLTTAFLVEQLLAENSRIVLEG